MLVLFESSAGYAIFKVVDENKLRETENLFLDFETPEKASKVVKLKHFEKFNDMTDALSAATAAVEGKMTKRLKKLLKKVVIKDTQDQLAVADAKLGNIIREKLQISCVSNTAIQELMRCIRSQMDSLITGLPGKEMAAMALGLAHSLSRYKLKFSPDKVDTMIIQAISLLDDLDKELNNYIMRCKEWYGWHFPELSKIITDNTAYIKTVQKMGLRTNAAECDLSDILPEKEEQQVKEFSEISMGTEISEEDMLNINHLCNEITEMQVYRNQLFEYLENRMMAVAPNITTVVGELIGARLIAHAGSLLNLAKHPASTVQILGAEKALFRALKTKHDTPKYGILFHAKLVGQSNPRLKGKASRIVATKATLCCRMDAFGDDCGNELGAEHKSKIEARLKLLEEGGLRHISGTGKKLPKQEKYECKSEVFEYKVAQDSTLPSSTQKRKFEPGDDDTFKSSKKIKMEIKQEVEEDEQGEEEVPKSEKKKKKKKHLIEEMGEIAATPVVENEPKMSKKKKKKLLEESMKTEPEDESFSADRTLPVAVSDEKKKKKRKMDISVKNEPEDPSYDMPAADESLSITDSGKKKKKHKAKVDEQSQGMAADESTSLTESGKKKKMEASVKTEGDDQSFDLGVNESLSAESKKKKKKKDKHNITDEFKSEGEITTAQSFDQAETSLGGSEKKKKKKHKHTGD